MIVRRSDEIATNHRLPPAFQLSALDRVPGHVQLHLLLLPTSRTIETLHRHSRGQVGPRMLHG